MKKVLSIAALCAGLFVAATATAQVYEQGKNIIHAGVGFGSAYYGTAGAGTASYTPPIHVSFEHGLKEKIGIGGLIGMTGSKYVSTIPGGEYTIKYSYIVVGVRGAYHFYNEGKLDAYAGAMLGYNIASATTSATGPFASFYNAAAPSVGGVAFGGFVGGRYAFNDKFMAFGELGYSIAWLSVGVGYKF